MPYGDQIMFTSRKNYDRVGEFKAVYLLEDYMLVRKKSNLKIQSNSQKP